MKQLTQDILNVIREKYSIPENYLPYFCRFNDDMLKKFSKKLDYGQLWVTDNATRFSVQDHGCFKGRFFMIIRFSLDCDEEQGNIVLFTDDVKRFFNKYLKGKPEIKQKLCISPGLFQIKHTMFGPRFVPISMGNSIKPILNDDLYEQLDSEIDSFLKKEAVYASMKIDYKRGILLYGPPGNGKTSFIKHFLKGKGDKFISIMMNIHNDDDCEVLEELLSIEEYDKYLKVIVIEDIDGMSTQVRSEILNFLDGVSRAKKVLFIATTNYPERLDIALKNRPSRFDAVIKIDLPNEKSRDKLLRHYFKDMRDKEIREAVQKSKGFSGAYFKELFILSKLNDMTISQSIERMLERFRVFGNGELLSESDEKDDK